MYWKFLRVLREWLEPWKKKRFQIFFFSLPTWILNIHCQFCVPNWTYLPQFWRYRLIRRLFLLAKFPSYETELIGKTRRNLNNSTTVDCKSIVNHANKSGTNPGILSRAGPVVTQTGPNIFYGIPWCTRAVTACQRAHPGSAPVFHTLLDNVVWHWGSMIIGCRTRW